MRQYFFYAALMLFTLSCSKSKMPQGPAYVKTMCGTRMFHRVSSGYNPYSATHFSDTSDVSMEVGYRDDGTISFDSEVYQYDSTNGIIAAYHYEDKVNLVYGYLAFKQSTDSIYAVRSNHVSAAAGDWETLYYTK